MSDDAFVDAQLRALAEVSAAQAATLTIAILPEGGDESLDDLTEAALRAGYAVASASLGKHALNDLPEVVRALSRTLQVGRGQRPGLVPALEAFAAAHGRRSIARFDARATEVGLWGELARLARATLEATAGDLTSRRLERWLAGRRPGEIDDGPSLRVLGPATARSTLAALTRLASVLGAKGMLIVLGDGEALVDLSPARRDVAYTVLRELIDNSDGHRGLYATKVLLAGDPSLLERRHALLDHAALASRISVIEETLDEPPTPHASLIRIHPPARTPRGREDGRRRLGKRDPVPGTRLRELRALLRLGQGLPPVDALAELTLGLEAIDGRIEALFEHASDDGSVFAVMSGSYGSGKTHLLLHLEARAIEARRPVLRLSVERLDEDLGNPQRHLRRLLESAVLPMRGRPGLFERLDAWLGSETYRSRFSSALAAIAEEEGDAARLAARLVAGDELDVDAVRETLSAADLVDKPNGASYRKDAYSRLLLWLELVRRLDGCEGPVVVLDEAENLYHPGISRAERRTALRSLGFYCGGAIPRACVVLAVTPDTLERLRNEAGELLDEIEDQVTLLPQEDVAMLRRRLLRSRPLEIKRLSRADMTELAERARTLHARVRGKIADPDWDKWLPKVVAHADTPRLLLRRLIDRLEHMAFAARA